ncbi:MAG: DNA recombination protein RmuC [Patescibacteria group bacterium]|nr:DNA recombination protein RmuC [Patescibacteria group bacterium]MDE2173643.1 DNA recombination protein RmuC [Patescibacteria group bacterium]
MSIFAVALIVLALLLMQGIGLYFILRRREPREEGGMVLLQQQMQELARTLDARVSESSRAMQENSHRQFSESARLIKEITQEVTSVKEIGRQTQGFAEQLQNLQDILKNPKQRGILGEYYLETVLKNVLPPGMYQMQYPFKNGEIVDAAVFVSDKVVPIDSKFSLDNYNRLVHASEAEKPAFEKAFVNDLKMRIQETAKYIRPEEGTMDFAFMFIPSEGIYYDLLTNQVGSAGGLDTEENLIQRAAGKHKVIIVSPTSFLAYLQTVMQGLKALKIEEKAAEIQQRVGELGKHVAAYEQFYKKLGVSLGTSVSHYNAGYKELGKIDKDVYRIAETKAGIEPELLEKPLLELDKE